jgi:hypothetical protein
MKKKMAPTQGYAHLMEEIKDRIEAIQYLASSKGYLRSHNAVTIESVCLQLRKVLELIAFSSLIANKEAYEKAHADFATHWNPRFLIRNLESINPHFYPEAVVQTMSQNEGIKAHIQPIEDGFLTKKEFLHVFEKCGGMLHALNPYGSRTGYHYFEKSIPVWAQKIVNLLNVHAIKTIGRSSYWLVHMKGSDGKVYVYELEENDYP